MFNSCSLRSTSCATPAGLFDRQLAASPVPPIPLPAEVSLSGLGNHNWNKVLKQIFEVTCPLDKLSHLSGPCDKRECSSSILSLRGGNSKGAPIDRASPTAYQIHEKLLKPVCTTSDINTPRQKLWRKRRRKLLTFSTVWGIAVSTSLNRRFLKGRAWFPRTLPTTPPAMARDRCVLSKRRHSNTKYSCSLQCTKKPHVLERKGWEKFQGQQNLSSKDSLTPY